MNIHKDVLNTSSRMVCRITFLLFVFSFGLAGCDSGPSEPPVARVAKGTIIVNGDPAWIVINGQTVSAGDLAPLDVTVTDEPVVVRAGVPFEVMTSTFVAPGCQRVRPSVVTTEGRTSTVTVYDAILNVECAFILATFPRTDRISFATPGLAEVVVSGSQFIRGEGSELPAEFRFPVVVQ